MQQCVMTQKYDREKIATSVASALQEIRNICAPAGNPGASFLHLLLDVH